MKKRILAAAVLAASIGAQADITYTRQPRAVTPSPLVKPTTGPYIEDASNWQFVSDIGRVITGFTRSDVVRDNLVTPPEVIHDCTSDKLSKCVAMEARTNPAGTKTAYVVAWAKDLYPIAAMGLPTDQYTVNPYMAEIWIYDIATKTKQRITTGHQDRQPTWLNNDTLIFASDRLGVFPPMGVYLPTTHIAWYPMKSMQIHRGTVVDGNLINIVNLTPHESMTMNPTVLSSGQILYSCWNGYGQRGATHTATNQWWICGMNGNGTNGFVELGAHGSPNIPNGKYTTDWSRTPASAVTDIRGLRPPSEIYKGFLAVVSYYRGNSTGAMGEIFGWTFNSLVEGVSILDNWIDHTVNDSRIGSGRYIPFDLKDLTPWAQGADASGPNFAKDGRAAGRAGYPAPWPGDGPEWMYARAHGWCFVSADLLPVTSAAMGGEPPCKKDISLALQTQVKNPFDPLQSRTIACAGNEWQCWDGQSMAPYVELFGQAEPVQPKALLPGKCFLQVTNLKAAELSPIPGSHFPDQNTISYQGNADPDYAAKVAFFQVRAITMWDQVPTVLGWKASTLVANVAPESDGSLRMEVPCETPLEMSGTDKDGKVVAQDHMLHSLRSGETRTCDGCHDGHSQERQVVLQKIKPTPQQRFQGTIAGQKKGC